MVCYYDYNQFKTIMKSNYQPRFSKQVWMWQSKDISNIDFIYSIFHELYSFILYIYTIILVDAHEITYNE